MCGAHNSKFIIQNSKFLRVVPGRLELPTSTLSVWRSNQLSYRTGRKFSARAVTMYWVPGFFFLLFLYI